MEQQIRFCRAADGVRIAYATLGSGPPLVKAANWITHLEFDLQSPVWQHWWERLSTGRCLVRYDERGSGLSDWDAEDLSFEAMVRDLEAVVDALSLDRFPLFGISQGGPIAAAYAARHSERVSHLIMFGSFARGRAKRGAEAVEEFDTQMALTRHGWGKDDPAYRQVFTTQFMPDATREQQRWFNDLQRASASPENAVRLQRMMAQIDVTEILPTLTVPTLVLHCRGDARVPFEAGRELAALTPGARLVPLEGRNHLPQPDDPCWEPLIAEIRSFIGDAAAPSSEKSRRRGTPAGATLKGTTASPSVVHSVARTGPAREAVTSGAAPSPAGRAVEEARALIGALDDVRLGRFSVVGNYTRYDETARHLLKDVRHRIAAAFDGPSRRRDNHLLWAPPGSGKTYFVQQVAASLADGIRYQEINLAACAETDFRAGLGALDRQTATLCFVDEVDARPHEPWPYETLLPYLDEATGGAVRWVFVLAGSGGAGVAEMKQSIAARPKGPDLLSRIPGGNEQQIPPMGAGDRVLVVLSQMRHAAREAGREIRAVEKLGLYYTAVHPRLGNARQLREFALRAVERVPRADDRVPYDHMFDPGDPENKAFWMRALPAAEHLVSRFTTVED